MGNKQIRSSQLIAPFGPGSIYTDRLGTPLLVAGLDYWYKRTGPDGNLIDCDNKSEFDISEPRISRIIDVARFRKPPDYRIIRQGNVPPPNANLHVPAFRFPTWYRHTKTAQLRKFELNHIDIPRAEGGRWQPVRFIAVCPAGHIQDFPWKEWANCSCTDNAGLVLVDKGGSELSSVRVSCSNCITGKEGRSLAGTTILPTLATDEDPEQRQSAFQKIKIPCHGRNTWLGPASQGSECEQPLVAALINQTNLHYSRIFSSIAIPSTSDSALEAVCQVLRNDSGASLDCVKWREYIERRPEVLSQASQRLTDMKIAFTKEQLIEACEIVYGYKKQNVIPDAAKPTLPESALSEFRREEFNVLRNRVRDSDDLVVVPTPISDALSDYFNKVNLIERLKETRVFCGFDRLVQTGAVAEDMPGRGMKQLFLNPPMRSEERWLPAVKVYGEGIYIEIREDKLKEWQRANAQWLGSRLNQGFITRLSGVTLTLPPARAADIDWASRYLLIHSLSHIIINQLVFECGYSTSALKERLYVSSDPVAPMAGLLIYTASGDSEGTLGGLVRLGRKELFEPLILRALNKAIWCSADPVCSENLGGTGVNLANLAACHSCTLLPETCCETINQGLDRSMIVGTTETRKHGFLSELIEKTGNYSY
jgi:hypothetical protein